ncbi:uncharacterized protein LOC121381216 isoform X5 [Gigantopelta aegis]|uniref:uncharacterized protein LOC121381216 isoform X5 n=1 Tax=Gigantopelta aegis TaxID=1735272 RepID=UPI001B88AA14|nr:uncharacterized protein LOC121381216 isoform X5 [Gigantopelta aegis]
MEEEASCPALMASNSEGSRKSRLTGNSGSSTSIKCRICQLTESETGEPVKTSDCRCKRDLASVHRSCLTDWVNYKGNNTCEVCKAPFANVPAPILTENIDGEQTGVHALFLEYSQMHPMTLGKRTKLFGLLFFVTVVSAAVGTTLFNTSPTLQGTNLVRVESTNKFEKLLFALWIMGVACVLGIVALWGAMEADYISRRRRIRRQALRLGSHDVCSDLMNHTNI